MYSKLSDNKIDYLEKRKWENTFSNQDLRHLATHYAAEKKIVIHVEAYAKKSHNRLNPQKTIDEMNAIQQQLSDDEYVGYLYNNNARDDEFDHFECFIIGKEKIIKPLMWVCSAYKKLEVEGAACSDTTLFNSQFIDKGVNLIPQAGGEECGPLSISHLKNYLINDAAQLKEFTLSIPCYKPNQEKPTYFFIPSPQVLRYSQNELYNQFIEALVTIETTESQVITYTKHTLHFETLEAMLNKTMTHAISIDDHVVVNEVKNIVANLPAFRVKWLNEYQSIKQKRSLMHCGAENLYLDYTCHRMRRIILNEEQKYNSVSTLLEEYGRLIEKQTPNENIERVLQEAVAKIEFKNSAAICNFLKKIDPVFYPAALLAINNFPIELNELSAASNFLLTKIQQQALIEAIQLPDCFHKIVLQIESPLSDSSLQNPISRVTFATVIAWVIFLQIPKNQLIDFLDKQNNSHWFNEYFQRILLAHCTHLVKGRSDLGDYLGDAGDEIFNQIVLHYATENWLISNIGAFFKKNVFANLMFCFDNKQDVRHFVVKHLQRNDIETYLLTLDPSELMRHIDYLRTFLPEEQASFIWDKIGEKVLLASVKNGDISTLLSLLNKYALVEERTQFFHAHFDEIVQLISTQDNNLPLNVTDKGNLGLQFFCPDNDKDVIEKYRNLFENEQNKHFINSILNFMTSEEAIIFKHKVGGSPENASEEKELAIDMVEKPMIKEDKIIESVNEDLMDRPITNLSTSYGDMFILLNNADSSQQQVSKKTIQQDKNEQVVNTGYFSSPFSQDLVLGLAIGLSLLALVLIITVATGGLGSPIALLFAGFGAQMALTGAAAFWTVMALVGLCLVGIVTGVTLVTKAVQNACSSKLEDTTVEVDTEQVNFDSNKPENYEGPPYDIHSKLFNNPIASIRQQDNMNTFECSM